MIRKKNCIDRNYTTDVKFSVAGDSGGTVA